MSRFYSLFLFVAALAFFGCDGGDYCFNITYVDGSGGAPSYSGNQCFATRASAERSLDRQLGDCKEKHWGCAGSVSGPAISK